MIRRSIEGKEGEARNLLKQLKANPKLYKKILDTLDIIGFFEPVMIAEVYDRNKQRGRVDLVLSDKDNALFIITPKSNSKGDLNIIKKLSGNTEEVYDITIVKKNDVTTDNVDLCRCDKIYNTRFGRVISDRKTYVTALFGDHNIYQMLCDFSKPIDIEPLLADINARDDKPSFKEFTEGLEKVVPEEEMDNIIELNSYDEFVKTSSIKVRRDNVLRMKI